jgi:CRISPR-associated endonuclease/helicase Cas3
MKYSKILAKSDPPRTLIEHTDDCLVWFSRYISWNNALICKISEKYSIPLNLLYCRLFLTIALHDIGKATIKFQKKVRGLQYLSNESHALSSVPILFGLVKDSPLCLFDDIPYFPEILAVASHHSKLKKGLFDNFNRYNPQYIESSFFVYFFNVINNKAHALNLKEWKDIVFSSKLLNANPYYIFEDDVLLNIEEDGFKYEETDIIRDLFLLFKSTLQYCDWLASSGNTKYKYSVSETTESITGKMKQNVSGFLKWSSFQEHASLCGDKNIFVQIPTGQGKTEASILWSVDNINNRKILFLLPTMVTTNKMWRRLLNFFDGNDTVGLSHSAAQYILKKENEDIEPEQLRQHYLYNRTFFKPVTVATVDQLIYSFFNWGHWVLTNAASYNAKIVIDEIHIYDAYTFGLLLGIIQSIKAYNSKFAIMSASLPNILKEQLTKVLPDYELINDDKFNNEQRHIISVLDDQIECYSSNIINEYKLCRKVLVVCNTIKKARDLYGFISKKVNKGDVMLYHSQFILCDKIEKETFLENIQNKEGGFIAICTQIVEVSLDIDFDVLYTENAPIDAIIQRLGRVNRKGKINNRISDINYGEVFITKESENSRKYVYKDSVKILDETYNQLRQISEKKKGNLNEADLKRIVEIAYTKENLGQRYFETLDEGRTLIHKLWNDFLCKIYTLSVDEAKLNKISSRSNDYITVECVLLCHYQIINFDEAYNNNQFDLIKEYEIKVPLHIVKKFAIRKINDSDIYILDIQYSKNEGLSLKPDDQNFM